MRRWILVVLAVITAVGAPAQSAGRLADSASPYLQQHAGNPVDWYPWGAAALAKARTEGKLIFVSVGYSSCHWCHVMREESFEDAIIAGFLNRHFISIKIDRESRPDLDEQLLFATELLSGTSGWPNSVFLTPDGDPFHAGGYFPPEAFQIVLSGVVGAWRDDPGFMASEARRVTAAIAGQLARKAEATELSPDALDALVQDLLAGMDPFNGGYGESVKFPREPLFLFLLDHAERSGDPDLLQAVTLMLDGMIGGGIHDHVGGGFHRYAVDPAWHIPHFEKMLYTQALTGRLLMRAWRVTGAGRYRRAAERAFAYVLRDMTAPGGGFYSAQDADSLTATGETAEGAFYTWTREDLFELGEADFARDVFQITAEGDLEGANVLHLADLPDALAADHGMTLPALRTRLDRVTGEMFNFRAARPAPFTDRKIILSWNAEMIATLAEASHLFADPAYMRAAEGAARFVLTNMAAPDGFYRLWFDGTANTPAQLTDYAALGLALVALHDHAPNPVAQAEWLGHARTMAAEIQSRFATPDGYRLTTQQDGLAPIIAVDDTELPAGNALALALFSRLTNRMPDVALEQGALALSAAMSGHARDAPLHRAGLLGALSGYLYGASGDLRYAAKGAVRVAMSHDRASGDLTVDLDIADGWHVNANAPLEDYFIATELSLVDGPQPEVRYPAPVMKSLSFNSAPLALYEGGLRLTTNLASIDRPQTVTLTLQACSDEICLQPEDIRFALW